MSDQTVRANWVTWQRLLSIHGAALGVPPRVILEMPDRNVPPDPNGTPATNPTGWADWAAEVTSDLNVQRIFRITDEALRNAAGVLAAEHAIAGSVVVPAPTDQQ